MPPLSCACASAPPTAWLLPIGFGGPPIGLVAIRRRKSKTLNFSMEQGLERRSSSNSRLWPDYTTNTQGLFFIYTLTLCIYRLAYSFSNAFSRRLEYPPVEYEDNEERQVERRYRGEYLNEYKKKYRYILFIIRNQKGDFRALYIHIWNCIYTIENEELYGFPYTI